MIEKNTLVQTEDTNLLRDIHSKALINKNVSGLNEYKTKKLLLKKIKEEDSETKQRLSKIEQDMSELKELIKEIIQLRKNND
jgi:hypothetical protein